MLETVLDYPSGETPKWTSRMSSSVLTLETLEKELCITCPGDSPPAWRPGRGQPHLQLPSLPSLGFCESSPPKVSVGTQGVWS